MTAPTRGAVKRWGFRLLLLASLTGAVLAYGAPLYFQARGEALFVLTGGSMGDTYPAGSAVVAEPVTPDQLRVDQVITFKETLRGQVRHPQDRRLQDTPPNGGRRHARAR